MVPKIQQWWKEIQIKSDSLIDKEFKRNFIRLNKEIVK